MKYKIVYESRTGNTAKVAQTIAQIFPGNAVELTDITAQEPSLDGDVYCIGFGVHYNSCPLKILDFLDMLSGKTILFFATCGSEPTEERRKALERNIESFLPDHCDYRGLFLCQGAIPAEGAEAMRRAAEKAGRGDVIEHLKDFCDASQSHPDESDLQNACRFVQTTLGQNHS